MFAKRNIGRSSRIFLAVLAALLMTLSVTSLARAGGWAVVTLDSLPGNIIAGEPYAIGFMVRQHGRTPFEVEQIPIRARQVETGQSLTFTALPDDIPGHYQAELLFTKPGQWEWSVQSGLYPDWQPMPALKVVDKSAVSGASAPAAAAAPAGISIPAGGLLGVLALISLAAGVALLMRTGANSGAKRAQTLAGAGLLVLCGALAFASFSSVNAAVRAAPASAAPAVDAGTASGQELFLAKGCVVCHSNGRALKDSEQYSVQAGPNLTEYRNDPEYLRKFLADPSAVKPGTEMPTLGLSPAEIDALVAFINAD